MGPVLLPLSSTTVEQHTARQNIGKFFFSSQKYFFSFTMSNEISKFEFYTESEVVSHRLSHGQPSAPMVEQQCLVDDHSSSQPLWRYQPFRLFLIDSMDCRTVKFRSHFSTISRMGKGMWRSASSLQSQSTFGKGTYSRWRTRCWLCVRILCDELR